MNVRETGFCRAGVTLPRGWRRKDREIVDAGRVQPLGADMRGVLPCVPSA
jgi:hypothetical protein